MFLSQIHTQHADNSVKYVVALRAVCMSLILRFPQLKKPIPRVVLRCMPECTRDHLSDSDNYD